MRADSTQPSREHSIVVSNVVRSPQLRQDFLARCGLEDLTVDH